MIIMFDDDNMYSSYSQYHDDDINSHIHHDDDYNTIEGK